MKERHIAAGMQYNSEYNQDFNQDFNSDFSNDFSNELNDEFSKDFNREANRDFQVQYQAEYDLDEAFCRSRQLLGEQTLTRLANTRVAVFGLGGVGGYALEALARCGIGQFLLVDGDRFALSNLNRQLLALLPDIGRAKVAVAAERLRLINPECWVEQRQEFFGPENAASFPLGDYDYVVDAIDSVGAKAELICRAQAAGARIISCLGTGNKLDPMGFRVADIYQTSVCPLARVMRHELRRRGVASLPVVYSQEQPKGQERSGIPGSVAFVPSAAGLLLASWVVRDIIERENIEQENFKPENIAQEVAEYEC